VFISFEGIEASGKSTVMGTVERMLQGQGAGVITICEPGGTPAGEAIRSVFLHPDLRFTPITELMLINASRAQLVTDVIRPALRRGTVVLCDRYVHSTIAYQGYGRGLDLQLVRQICDAATGGVMPEIAILVDVSLETAQRRIIARGDAYDRIEQEDQAFHRRVRKGFLELAAHDDTVIAIDGERSPEEVADAALAAISAVMA
jgi:dTMP kinase